MKNNFMEFLSHLSVGDKTLADWTEVFQSYMLGLNEEFDPGHRMDHLYRVANNVFTLTLQETDFSYPVLVPAIWLHDCVPTSKFSDQRSMASKLSADAAIDLLKEWGYPSEYYPAIGHVILTHSFSAGITPESIDAKIMQDADRLDALGAVGIARTFMVGGQFGNAIYEHKDPFAENRQLDEKSYITDHFYTKLLKLADSFQTESGKHEAARRTEFMYGFLRQLGD